MTRAMTMDEAAKALRKSRRWLEEWLRKNPVNDFPETRSRRNISGTSSGMHAGRLGSGNQPMGCARPPLPTLRTAGRPWPNWRPYSAGRAGRWPRSTPNQPTARPCQRALRQSSRGENRKLLSPHLVIRCGCQAEKTNNIKGDFEPWCARRDSNPHDVTHCHLKAARLPIPPRALKDRTGLAPRPRRRRRCNKTMMGGQGPAERSSRLKIAGAGTKTARESGISDASPDRERIGQGKALPRGLPVRQRGPICDPASAAASA